MGLLPIVSMVMLVASCASAVAIRAVALDAEGEQLLPRCVGYVLFHF